MTLESYDQSKSEEDFSSGPSDYAQYSEQSHMSTGLLSAEDIALMGIQDEKLVEALNVLPESFKTALLLNTVGGYSYKEVAEIMGTKLGTVMSRLSRAKEAMREILSADKEKING